MKNDKNKNKGRPPVPISMVRDAQDKLVRSLETDRQFSVEPDPDGRLGLTPEQKKFLKAYIEFRTVSGACSVAHIDKNTGMEYYMDPKCRSEIRRINLALYYRKFSRRLLSIDEIGGYLTSLLIEEDISEAEKLEMADKLQVVKLIMELNKLKADAYKNPRIIEDVSFVENEIKDMSPEDLKKLIEETKKSPKDKENEEIRKSELIDQLTETGYLEPSEIAYLKTCSIEELEQLVLGIPEKTEKEMEITEYEESSSDQTEDLSIQESEQD